MSDDKKLAIFHAANGDIRFSIDFEVETIWANVKQIADLFGVHISAASSHISKIYIDGELDRLTTVRLLNGAEVYNLDVIISVGYRVDSTKATQFRKWATNQIKELVTKGFVIDEQRFAEGQLEAFQRLVDKVREIRTSEKHFYQKITDIFATSTDYLSSSNVAKKFFATIQNKFHYAIHGHTAAELISARVDASKSHMGLTNWQGNEPTQREMQTAKNYLSELEMKRLELLSEQFLSFAELRYYEKKSMTMQEWDEKLNDFLAFNEKEVLDNNGNISRDRMIVRVQEELNKYKQKNIGFKKI